MRDSTKKEGVKMNGLLSILGIVIICCAVVVGTLLVGDGSVLEMISVLVVIGSVLVFALVYFVVAVIDKKWIRK